MKPLIAVAAALIAGATVAGPEIKIESTGETRAKLDEMCFKPFDFGRLAGLKDWAGGDPVTAERAQGKVVLLVTWSSWYKTSHQAAKIAQSLYERFGDQGLIVVGLHHREGFSKAGETARSLGLTFPVALDAENGFRTAFHSTQDPDFFLVDRAGRLRFADVQTASIEAATQLLVEESAEQAAQAGPTPAKGATATASTPKSGPALSVDPAAYRNAEWPEHNRRVSHAKNLQGKPLPTGLGREKYLGEKPDTEGRVMVIDFWATWCGPCIAAMPRLDQIQKKFEDDLVVVGISDESEAKVRNLLKQQPHGYAQAVEPSGTLKRGLGIQGIPHVVVLSSDKVIRWQGHPADADFEKTVKAVIEADPGVKARRTAAKK